MIPQKEFRHFQYLDSDQGQIHYWTAGNGPNLLLLHQSDNSSEEYAAIVPFLKDYYRMIAIDLPGHGRTYNPQTEPKVKDYAAAVRHVLDTLEIDKANIVGHHGGSLTAMFLIASEPERFDKIILSGVDEEYTPEGKQALRNKVMSNNTNVETDGYMSDTWNRYLAMSSKEVEPKLALKPFMAFLDARLRPFRGILTNLNWERSEAIAKLRGPMLFVTGQCDNYVVKQERLLALIPDSEHLELAGGGTFMFYDYPEQCAKMILNYFNRT